MRYKLSFKPSLKLVNPSPNPETPYIQTSCCTHKTFCPFGAKVPFAESKAAKVKLTTQF
jgi:hypothetical protein